jgi:photosystem II stability/assembly factor-like uncharacterized protein
VRLRKSSCLLFSLLALAVICTLSPKLLLAQDHDKPKVSQEPGKTPVDRFEEEGEGKESDFIRKRMAWFHDQRAYPNNVIPPGIRARAVEERDRKIALESALSRSLSPRSTSATAQPAWSLIGPKPLGFYGVDAGRVTALAVDPANPKILYMGGAEGGVWQSVDSGTTWRPLTDKQPSLAVGSITIDPSNSNTIYVGTGEENFSGDSYYGAGILKSTDGGTTWTQYLSSLDSVPCGGQWVGAIAVQPTNSNIVLAGVESCYYGGTTMYRSADAGHTWSAVLTNSNAWEPVTAVLFDPANIKIAYAATDGGGLLKSTDAGLTWNPANGSGNNAFPTENLGRMALAMAPSNPSIMYAAVASSQTSDLLGIYKTVDGGNNWAQLPNAPNFCSTQCWYDIVLAVSPANPNFIAAGGVYPYHPGGSAVTTSTDGGSTWVEQSNGLHPDTHALLFSHDGSTLYTGNDGGVWSTTNPTANQIAWTDLNSSLAITEFYPGLSMDQGNVNHSYVGAQDNASEKYTGQLAWTAVDCGDGGATIMDYTNTSVVYANCIGESLDKSTDDGASFNDATNGLNSDDRTAWVPPVSIDPLHHETLYFGTYRVYQTTNGAGLWTPISGDLTGTSGNGTLNTIAVARTDPNTIYTGSSDARVHVTRNALATVTWTDVSGATNTTLPNRNVTWIAVDPTIATTAYAGFSGFTGYGDKLGHIFKTTNAGGSWTDVSGDLPNTPVNAILVDPDAPETIFIGTDVGAFYTTTGGTSWSALGTGLPNVVVTGLGLHESSRTLRATTHGRSTWDLNVASLLPIPTVSSISPLNFTADSPAVKLTVTGYQFTSKSAVVWGGGTLATTFVNSGELTAIVPATDLAKAGTVSIGVLNGAGGKLSNLAVATIENPDPKLTALSKTSALAGSGALTLTLTGSNFVAASKVAWKGIQFTTTFHSQTSISAVIPASDLATAGTAAVAVVNPAPEGGTSAALTFTIVDPVPTMTALSPVSATAGGSAFVLTVSGTNFVAASKILWNGSPLTTSFVNATKLYATIPAAEIAKAGSATVAVSNPAPGGGTSVAHAFAINNPIPTVTALTPASATAGGAAFVLTVTGTKFVSTSKVLWNGAALTTTYESSTKLTATVPAAEIAKAGSAAIVVTNPAPGGGASAAHAFPVDDPIPTLTALTPASATADGAAFVLTVTGTKFVSTSKVLWNGAALTTTYESSKKLTATVPAAEFAKAGSAAVVVTNPAPGGGASAARAFPVDNPIPAITALSPASAKSGGAAFTLTLSGTRFVSSSKIRWNGTALTTTFVSATKLTAVVPAADVDKVATASVTVSNPAPGGGTSTAVNFRVD